MWTDLTRTRRHGTNLKERGAARMLESSLLTTTTQKPVPEPTSSAAKSISVDFALVLFVTALLPPLPTGTGAGRAAWEGKISCRNNSHSKRQTTASSECVRKFFTLTKINFLH